jgi:hypothetical protein
VKTIPVDIGSVGGLDAWRGDGFHESAATAQGYLSWAVTKLVHWLAHRVATSRHFLSALVAATIG